MRDWLHRRPDPPAAPGPDPTPPPDPEPPAPEPTDLERLIEQLSSFDPGAITQRLDSLEASLSGSEIVEAIRGAFGDVFTTLAEALEGIKGMLESQQTPKPKPKPRQDPPAPPEPPEPPPVHKGGLIDSLFGVPTVGGEG